MNENKKLYDLKYHRENLKQIKINCHIEYDKDILEHLSKKENKQKYIKDLIRKDIKKVG